MITATFIEKNKNFQKQMKSRQAVLDDMNSLEVAIGYPVNKSGLGTPYYDSGLSTIQVAVANNFGYGVPQRDFMTPATENIKQDFKKISEELRDLVEAGYIPVKTVLGLVGQKGASHVKAAIRSNIPPPNAESTIKRKESSKTLIDTGHLMQSATYIVREAK